MKCQSCTVYEATTETTFMKLKVALCFFCLTVFRKKMKIEFKRVDAARIKSRVGITLDTK